MKENFWRFFGDREPLKRPSIKFHYVVHSEENADEIWQQLGDADVILLESVMRPEQKVRLMGILETARNTNDPGRKLQSVLELAKFAEPFSRKMILKVAYSDKELHLVDCETGSPAMRKTMKAMLLEDVGKKMFLSGNPELALSAYKNYLRMFAEANREREEIVINQIGELEKKHSKDWSGKKIAVVQGAAHSIMFRRYREANPDQETKKMLPSPNFKFEGDAVIMRIINLFPDRPIDDIVYKRILLSEFLVFTQSKPKNGNDYLDKAMNLQHMVARIPENLIDFMWAELVANKVDADQHDLLNLPGLMMKLQRYTDTLRKVKKVIFGYNSILE